MINEEQLIKRCIRRERSAQKLLFETYSGILLGICMRFVKDKAEAEDILQEGFLKIFLNIRDFTARGSLVNWMKKIMVNTAITYYHKTKKHYNQADIEEVQEVGIVGYKWENADFTSEELLKVINDLPEGYKIVFNLYAIEGFKHKEIAALMDIDINTSKSQYSRAKKLIRKRLGELSREKVSREEDVADRNK